MNYATFHLKFEMIRIRATIFFMSFLTEMVTGMLTIEQDVFRGFAFYSGVILAKMLLMSPITGFTRVTTKVSYPSWIT